MKPITLLLLLGLNISMGWAAAYDASPAGRTETRVQQQPYDYQARNLLRTEQLTARRYAAAYWHAAWLCWLGPQRYVEENAAFLANRENRDRAARQETETLSPVLAAVDAQRQLTEACLQGTIGQQAGRIRRESAAALEQAGVVEGARERSDPVARMALVQLALTVDDAMRLEQSPDAAARRKLLRNAATRASTVSSWLPEAPGPHLTLTLLRARLAELDGRTELWGLAIEEARQAQSFDPENTTLPNLLWTLNLRAGRWAEAARWHAIVTSRESCKQNPTSPPPSILAPTAKPQ